MSELAPISSNATTMLVALALDAATVKHAAMAQNIANANNEGYRAAQVDFDSQVAMFRDQLLAGGNDAAAKRAVESLRAGLHVTDAPDAEAAKVAIDVEVVKMTQNTLHYQALLTARGKLAAFMRMAVSGGR